MNDQQPKPVKAHSEWDVMSVDEFCQDPVAVKEWRDFLASDTGRKLAAAVRGADPKLALTVGETCSPAMIRSSSKMEGDAAETLLGKITGHTLMESLLFRRLTVPRVAADPKSARARGGRRDIPGASAVMPTT